MAASKTQTFLITGANRGLGLEMVKQLVESRACRVFAGCRDPDAPKSKALHDLAKKHPKAISVVKLDTSDPSSVLAAAGHVGAQLEGGRLNVLVNNAGVLPWENIQATSDQVMTSTFDTNVIGPVRVLKAFLPYLRNAAQSCGKPGVSCSKAAVINISTLLSSLTTIDKLYTAHSAISYSISKAGLNMFNQCAVQEFKKDEIMFVLLHPGWVRTDMGGPEGDIDAPESVQGMLKVMDSLTEKQNGAFLDYTGKTVPW